MTNRQASSTGCGALAANLPALKSIKEGRAVPADNVLAWMQSWGAANELPRPKPEQRLPHNATYVD